MGFQLIHHRSKSSRKKKREKRKLSKRRNSIKDKEMKNSDSACLLSERRSKTREKNQFVTEYSIHQRRQNHKKKRKEKKDKNNPHIRTSFDLLNIDLKRAIQLNYCVIEKWKVKTSISPSPFVSQ